MGGYSGIAYILMYYKPSSNGITIIHPSYSTLDKQPFKRHKI